MYKSERGSILRLFFSLLTLHTWYCGLFDPKTLHYMITGTAGSFGICIINLFGVLGLLTLADTFVNNFLPLEFSIKPLLRVRHLMFMLIALLNASELFVALRFVQSWGLALYCLLITVFVVISAFSDIQTRYPGFKHART